mmetsp:Transcript_23427/g.67264  ORF Transcript_23427/g.67264 Transcript_23427/m.67264 type:complete len:944 (+) Transcript_23427:2462-5293(+)
MRLRARLAPNPPRASCPATSIDMTPIGRMDEPATIHFVPSIDKTTDSLTDRPTKQPSKKTKRSNHSIHPSTPCQRPLPSGWHGRHQEHHTPHHTTDTRPLSTQAQPTSRSLSSPATRLGCGVGLDSAPDRLVLRDEVLVDVGRRLSALGDGPHHKRLAPPAVTRHVHLLDVGAEGTRHVAVRRLVVAARVELQIQRFGHELLGTQETERQEHQIRLEVLFAVWDFRHLPPAGLLVALPLDAHGAEADEVAIVVAHELLGVDQELAGVLAELGRHLLVTVVNAEDGWPLWPGVGGCACRGLSWHELKVDDGGGPVSHGGADAVVAGVSSADDDDPLALGVDVRAVPGLLLPLGTHLALVHQRLGVLVQELHRKVHTLEIAAGDPEVACSGGAGGQHERVIFVEQLLGRGCDHGRVARQPWAAADVAGRPADVSHALLLHQLHPPHHHIDLVGLHVGHAIHHQTARPVGTLEDRHRVAHLVELVGSRHARRPRADDGDVLAGAVGRRLGDHPAHLESLVDGGALDVFDGDGILDDAQHTGALAGGGADAASELGEVVGLQQPVQGLLPILLVDQLVPLGDQVAKWASAGGRLAEWHAAVHAPGCLCLELLLVRLVVDLLEVRQPPGALAVALHAPLVLDEAAALDGLVHHIGAVRLRCCRGLLDGLLNILGHLRVGLARHRLTCGLCGQGGLLGGGSGPLLLADLAEVGRVDFDEVRHLGVVVVEDPGRHRRARLLAVITQHLPHLIVVNVLLTHREEFDHLHVALDGELLVGVVDISDAAAHAGGEVDARGPQDHHPAASHVLAPVVAHTLNHRRRTRVAHAEPLRCNAAEEGLTPRRTIECHVADDDVVLRCELGVGCLGRVDHDLSAREALADVVVGVALDLDGDAGHEEGAHRLAGVAIQLDVDRVFLQGRRAELLAQEVAQHRAHRPVHVGHIQLDLGGH